MKFYSLKIGEWFRYGDCVYVKINIEEAFNCIKFTIDGKYIDRVFINGQTKITFINIQFKIL